MLEKLPERVRTPAVLDAALSPSALLLAGAGASAAILGGLPLVAAGAAGALAYVARVALAIPRKRAGERINPSQVAEPWRRFVIEALQAQARFDRTVKQTQSGPLHDHLATIGRRIADGVQECWRIARQGDVLQGALKELNQNEVEADLERVTDELREASGSRKQSLERTRAALVSQRSAYERIASVWAEARDRLQVLNAQLDEAVARAVELSVHGADTDALQPLGTDVDNLVGELESLRLGLEEAGDVATG